MSADPSNAPPISIRRRGLIAPTQALAPSPTASLSALVQSGKDVAGIAEALGVSPDEARTRLDGIGLLDVVEPPAPTPASAAPEAPQGSLAGLLAPEDARPAAPAPAPAPISTSPSPAPVPAAAPVHEAPSASDEGGGDGPRRGRKPGRPPTTSAASIGQGWSAADFEALGRLYARALAEGTSVEALVSAARHVVELAERLRLG
jgi:hypothetical protein